MDSCNTASLNEDCAIYKMTAICCGLDDRGIGAHGPIQLFTQWVTGHFFYAWVKRLEREADHSSATRAEVKKTLIYTSIPQYVFMVYFLIS
jgi:hypothetical protein